MREMRVYRTGRFTGRLAVLMAVVVLLTSGCSLLFGGGAEEPAQEEERVLVPTFTPTTEGALPTATVAAVVEAPPQGQRRPQLAVRVDAPVAVRAAAAQ